MYRNTGGHKCLLPHSIFSLLMLAVLLAASVFGQSNSGDVTGAITDASGAAVSGAAVTATNEATGVKTTATANAQGVYRFTNLPVGSYTISASFTGFTAATVKGVGVDLNNTVTSNITLAVGSSSTIVEVSSAGAVIDTTTAQIQTTFSTTQISELPIASTGSGVYNLSLLGAGVATSGGVGQGAGPAISGNRPDNNVFTLDGVSNQNHYNPDKLVYVSNEGIAEMSLLQNQFNPEFGGGSGGIFNVIVKSGGNAVHGSLYEYLDNRKLNAVDATDAVQGLTSLPRFDNNRLGASIGGPIIRTSSSISATSNTTRLVNRPRPARPLRRRLRPAILFSIPFQASARITWPPSRSMFQPLPITMLETLLSTASPSRSATFPPSLPRSPTITTLLSPSTTT